ncbi:MAG TPA: glycosyltransferase family 2 protein [Bdellovibrionota bacterium]|nr:glycosyltransferase family 2 protein [Bdellovibrionota bacterium]
MFIPMYNEETNAGIVLPTLQRTLQSLTEDYEIVVVDDASRDRTVPLVEDYARRDPRIRLVRHEKNLGYGASLRTGFLSVTKEIVFYTDADVPIDFEILRSVVPLMEENPAIVGYRLDRHDTWRRWLFSQAYNLLLRLLFGLRVRDVNFSFKLIRKRAVDDFKSRLRSKSVFIDGEILVQLTRLGYAIREWPVEYRPRKFGLSTLGTWRQAWMTLTEIRDFYFRRGAWSDLIPSPKQ